MPIGKKITIEQNVHTRFLVENQIIKDIRSALVIDPKETIIQKVSFDKKGNLADISYRKPRKS